MKQEIEKILDECEEDQHHAWVMDKDKATIQLQKLFLQGHIDLLKDLRNDSNPTQAYDEMVKEIKKLQSELKQLE